MSDFTYQEGTALTWAQMNENLRLMQAKYLDSANSAAIAIAAANFKGNWSALTGALAVPASVYHSSKFWLLLSNLADVTAKVPGVDAEWLEIITGNVMGPASATAGNLATLDATGKVLSDGGVAPASLATLNGTQTLANKTLTAPVVNDGVLNKINGGQLAGLRNKIINGNFDVWQAGTSFTNANGYTADQWICASGSGVSGSVTQQAFTPGQTDVPGEPSYFARLVTGGASGANFFTQRIEDVRTFAGQTVMLSFYAKADAAVTLDTVRMRQNFGSGGSTEVPFGQTSINVTTSWQKFTVPFTVPSISGKTIGSSSYLLVEIRRDALSYTLDLAQVQLELGTVATPFEQRPIGLELALCQRYYYREETGGVSAAPYAGHVQMLATTQGRMIVRFPVPMRVRPTALEQSGTAANWQLVHGATSTALSSVPTFQSATTTAAAVDVFVASGLTVGQVGYLRATSTTNTYLAWSARL